jgi:hypothetical protein
MDNHGYKLRARFAPETRFELTPVPAALARGQPETELDRLKERLLGELLSRAPKAELRRRLRRAANDAAALAWLTPFPVLVLPVLLEELAEAARRQATRQEAILREGRVPARKAA